MTLLRLALLCFVLAAMGVLFVPFAVAKLLAGVFAVLFVVFLLAGLASLDRLAACTPRGGSRGRKRVREGAQHSGRREVPTIFGYVRVAVGEDASERLLKEESFYRELHQGYTRHFEQLGAAPGTVGVATNGPALVPSLLEHYEEAIDHVVVRALASASVDALSAVAEAAAP